MPDPLDATVFANKERRRDATLQSRLHVVGVARAVGVGGQAIGAGELRVLHRLLVLLGVAAERADVLFEEPFDRVEVLVADRHHGDVLLGVLLLQLREVRHAHDARTAPSGPELDDVHLARLELGDRLVRLQVGGEPMLDIERRGKGADGQRTVFLWRRGAVGRIGHAAGRSCHQHQQRRQPSNTGHRPTPTRSG